MRIGNHSLSAWVCSRVQTSILPSVPSVSKCSNGIRKCPVFWVGWMWSAVHWSLSALYNCQDQYWSPWPHIQQLTRQSELCDPIHTWGRHVVRSTLDTDKIHRYLTLTACSLSHWTATFFEFKLLPHYHCKYYNCDFQLHYYTAPPWNAVVSVFEKLPMKLHVRSIKTASKMSCITPTV